ncbi:MAG: hypothetical protein IME93_03720 [Proteobacteria bacterium]|nr:hypothetical protein [Pseudomonadota bacterium]
MKTCLRAHQSKPYHMGAFHDRGAPTPTFA